MNGHWTEDDFISRLYGIGPPDGHLDECGACRARWKEFQVRREFVRSAVGPEASIELLMAQRREIHRRMENPRTRVNRMTPVLAALGIVAMGLVLVQPSGIVPHRQETVAVVDNPASDEKFFREVAAIAQSSEPRAAKPIEALFQE